MQCIINTCGAATLAYPERTIIVMNFDFDNYMLNNYMNENAPTEESASKKASKTALANAISMIEDDLKGNQTEIPLIELPKSEETEKFESLTVTMKNLQLSIEKMAFLAEKTCDVTINSTFKIIDILIDMMNEQKRTSQGFILSSGQINNILLDSSHRAINLIITEIYNIVELLDELRNTSYEVTNDSLENEINKNENNPIENK